VLTVIVYQEDWSGVTAWKTRGADLRDYLEGKEYLGANDRNRFSWPWSTGRLRNRVTR
jgi:hypothetical protein